MTVHFIGAGPGAADLITVRGRDLIRASKEEGMQDFNLAFIDLINKGLISKKIAMEYSPNAEQLKMNLQGIFLSDNKRILG